MISDMLVASSRRCDAGRKSVQDLRHHFSVEVVLFAVLGLPGGIAMLFTLAVILFVLWLLGVVGTYTIGGIVHLLLVVALVLFVFGLLSGRRTIV
jgi:hypothetical protein